MMSAYVKARLRFGSDHLDDPEKSREKVMLSDETLIKLFGLNSIHCLEELKGVSSQEHHTSSEAWGWKHHALGVFFCTGDRSTVLRRGRTGHILSDVGQTAPSLSQSIEHGSWLGLPT